MRRRHLLIGAVAVGAALLAAGKLGARPSGDRQSVKSGGIFRVVTAGIDSIDPALTYGPATAYLDASCARLLRGASTPEVASGQPTISGDGKTYTFRLRKTFRFNTGTPVAAASFAHALDRVLTPAMHSPGAQYFGDILGADDVVAGKASHARGIQARGYTLTIHLTHPVPDFAARLTVTSACAVPPSLPADPEAVSAPFSGAGPYYVGEYVPGSKLVLRRNRSYGGTRPHRVDRVVVTVVDSDQTALEAIARGAAEWGDIGDPSLVTGLGASDRARLRVLTSPGNGVRYVVMNTSRRPFRNNVPLRRAVNLALDRPALLRVRGGVLVGKVTDHYLPSGFPGFRHVRLYPLAKPDLRRARALARGHTRSGHAVMYAQNSGPTVEEARVVKTDLAKIGIDTEIREFPGEQLYRRLFTPGEPYDLALTGWSPDYKDPYDFLNAQLEGRQLTIPNNANLSRFNSPRYNRLLARAAELRGKARYLAYGKLDLQLARDAAPLAAYMEANDVTIVSRRAGCLVHRHVDLAAVCLR
jgi:ABC-type oligopeptide transport system substrate-binding subunit